MIRELCVRSLRTEANYLFDVIGFFSGEDDIILELLRMNKNIRGYFRYFTCFRDR